MLHEEFTAASANAVVVVAVVVFILTHSNQSSLYIFHSIMLHIFNPGGSVSFRPQAQDT